MSEDQLEWERRSRTAKLAALSALLVSPTLHLLSPFKFRLDPYFLADFAGLMACLALLGFWLPQGKLRRKFPDGVPPVPEGHILINENGQGGCCLWGCFGVPLLFALPYCIPAPFVWLALLGCCIFICNRVQFTELVPEEGVHNKLVTWNGLVFRSHIRKLLAVACIGRTSERSTTPCYHPVLVFGDGSFEEVSGSFFRADAEKPIATGVRSFPNQSKPLLEQLRAWGESKGIPVLAKPISDHVAFKSAVAAHGLEGQLLMGDWSEPPVEPKSSMPPSAMPPE